MDNQVATLKNVLLVDPDAAFVRALRSVLGPGYEIGHVPTAKAALPLLASASVDVALFNWDRAESTAAGNGDLGVLIKAASQLRGAVPVIVYSWDTRRETALEVARQGAHDFFPQPLDVMALKAALDRAYEHVVLMRDLSMARRIIYAKRVEGLLGNSKPMQRVYDTINKVAPVSTTVLITGESGTGKEVAARAIHKLSPRRDKPFIAFSPCALPESLIEDELFGHEKGAFTGALHSRRGRFEEAHGGTVFLDEIADLAVPLQTKLLRVLQERSLERLGSSSPVSSDFRLICATNRDLKRMVDAGTFRQDLYFRISVVSIDMPPLRDRVDDISLLAEYFCRQYAMAHKKEIHGLSPGYLSSLVSYAWPGNVRELQNVVERSLVLADGPKLTVSDLPGELKGLSVTTSQLPKGNFQEAVRAFKRELIRAALRLHHGNKLQAAKELQISRCYLHRLINQLNIPGDEVSPAEEPAVDALQPVVETHPV